MIILFHSNYTTSTCHLFSPSQCVTRPEKYPVSSPGVRLLMIAQHEINLLSAWTVNKT